MADHRAEIIYEKDKIRYFDKNGEELQDGDTIEYASGQREKLYLTDKGMLGTDATNPLWIENGRAVPCEYGIYPLEEKELVEIVKVKLKQNEQAAMQL